MIKQLTGTDEAGYMCSWQDEALARHGVSREVPCSALKGETVPDSEGTTRRGTATPVLVRKDPRVPHTARRGACHLSVTQFPLLDNDRCGGANL